MTEQNPLRVFSFGGGRQSMSVLVMQALDMLAQPYDLFLFANVGEKAEHPDTLRYLREVAMPFAEEHSITLKEVARRNRKGEPVDLYDYTMNPETRSVPIPVYMAGGAPGKRSCTTDWKIAVIDRAIRQLDATHAQVALGISMDEMERMRDTDWHDRHGKKKFGFWKQREYPLVDMRMALNDCVSVIIRAGLPVPEQSACWFCPFSKKNKWQRLHNHHPVLFDAACDMEVRINEKRHVLGRDAVYLTRAGKPLNEAIGSQLELIPDDDCGGYCEL